MDEFDNWEWDEDTDLERWEKAQEEEPDEEWEELFYNSYREQFPEEFEEEENWEESLRDCVRNIVMGYVAPRSYADEPIAPRPPAEPLPAQLQAARALESGMNRRYQSRNALFLKQAKLLEHYEDDFPQFAGTTRYFPTYESLSDRELRSYFTFRTRLRRGEETQWCSTFVYLYIYELINGIGAENPRDGLEKLDALVERYSPEMIFIQYHWGNWRNDYLAYYDLPPELKQPRPEDRITLLDETEKLTTEEIVETLKSMVPIAAWLKRSKCYAKYQEEFHRVLADTLRGVSRHCSGKTRSLCDRYFGTMRKEPVQLFSSAIFANPLKRRSAEYCLSPWHTYSLENGMWFVTRRYVSDSGSKKLTELVKGVDNALRARFGLKPLLKTAVQPKWINTLIQESIAWLLAEREARQREQERMKIDYSALAQIRADAAITREKLRVAEETEEENPGETMDARPEPAPEVPQAEVPVEESHLSSPEYRLMHCLLYGGDTRWVQQEGLIASVLLDSINEKLYDIFQDTVVEDAGIVEDYIEELKEMIAP